jgi:glutamate synthase (NADPH/NADH) large chain
LFPICTQDASDSASFDEVVELLHLGGRSLPHAMLMMIPEAWENNNQMDPARREFYAFHSCLMEPWDGPLAWSLPTAPVVGGVLDRNGLRPGRFWVTDDGLVVLASEAGCWTFPKTRSCAKGRLQPGRMFLVDLGQHRIISDRGNQDTAWPRPHRTVNGCSEAECCSPTCPTGSTWCIPMPRSPGDSRCSATPRESCG